MIIDPKISGVSIVLVGSFNPRIFNPDWFVRNEILTDDQIKNADISVVHPQLTQIQFDLFLLVVQQDKLQISTTQGPWARLCDIVTKTFAERLPHTPVTAFGINRDIHYDVGSIELRDTIGHKLAPPDAWGTWAPALKAKKDEQRGGLFSLTMQQRVLADRPRGHIQATVQPSVQIPNTGIYIQINDHFEFPDADKSGGSIEAMKMLSARFDGSIERAEEIIDQVMAIRA